MKSNKISEKESYSTAYFSFSNSNLSISPNKHIKRFGIYCKFAINPESETYFGRSVECQSNKNRHYCFPSKIFTRSFFMSMSIVR